ncbi:MAG: hypothetical protein WEE89_11705 [Gemmatimonadota bacterium]
MPEQNNDRARLGEQSGRRNSEPVESEELVARPNQAENEEDLTAGDEGIEDVPVMRGNERDRVEREDISERSTRNPGSSRTQNSEDVTEFSGRGGQKGGSPNREQQGTGYTNDRSGQLQEDDSLSGSQSRHGTSGNGQGSNQGRSGTSDSERVGGQTAQNPRGKDRDIDRSKM